MQTAIVIAIVAIALVYLGRRYARTFQGQGGCACDGGCPSAGGEKSAGCRGGD